MNVRAVALFLTVLTGFSGLVYEVGWQNYLATLLGSHSEATAAVLGIFLGGLAVGYSLFGKVTRHLVARAAAAGRPPRLLFAYGFLEAAIGVYAFLFPWLFEAVQSLSFLISSQGGALAFALDVLLCALLIGPPTVMMGGTIPILTQALARSLADATRFHALVYGFNTAGAFAGALAAGFWLIPALGLVGVLVAMGSVNVFAGGLFIVIGRCPERDAPPAIPTDFEEGRGPVPGFAAYAVAALLCGFAMMTVQTAVIRVGGLAFGASQLTFSMVVAVFVLCIALGSFAVSTLRSIPAGVLVADLWVLAVVLGLLYLVLPDSTYWVYVLRSLFRDQSAGFYAFQFLAFLGILTVLALPVALSGATLPLIFHQLRRESAELGDVAGRLYSWNTVGSLLGALLGGYALLFWLDLHHVFRVALGAVVLGAVVITDRVSSGRRAGVRLATAGATLVAALWLILLLPTWPHAYLTAGLFRHRQPFANANSYLGPEGFFARYDQGVLRFYDDDPIASISVKETTDNGEPALAIVTNGKSDSVIPGDQVTLGLLALLPALLAEKAERAFIIGYGTGLTAADFASLDTAREVIVAEISPGVIRAAPLFDSLNMNTSQNPKVKIVRSDAYRALLRSEGLFDAIISEPSNPWVTGVEMLYSREFLTAARDRLEPGGVHAQWFHTYETDRATVELVLRTYASVFEYVALWYTIPVDMLLIGIRNPDIALDVERLAARVERPDFAAGLRRREIPGLPELLAHELAPVGVVQAARLPGALHTLTHPRLSHSAARAFFVGGNAELALPLNPEAMRMGRRNSLVHREIARSEGNWAPSFRERLVAETCRYQDRECATLLAQWRYQAPDSPERDRIVAEIESDPERKYRIPLSTVEPLSQLFGDGELTAQQKLSPKECRKMTQHFVSYYHHAAPFSPQALAEVWRRCVDPPDKPGRCRAGLAHAEKMLGELEVEPTASPP